MTTTTTALVGQALGITTVASALRVECHAPSGFTVRDYSGKPAANGIAPRDRHLATILGYWESAGVARFNRRAGGVWEARNILHDGSLWLPLADMAGVGRGDRIELSHVRSARNGGAWCACNLLPEDGANNAARGDRDMEGLSMSARSILAGWPEWWKSNVARKASLARLA